MDLYKKYTLKYAAGWKNLFLVAILTTVNLVLLIAQADLSFAFSATIPQFLLVIGMLLAEEGLQAGLVIGILSAALLTALYYICALLAKKRAGWLTAALVFFVLDTVSMFLLLEMDATMFIDVLFHAWVLYYLAAGVHAAAKLKTLSPPVEEPAIVLEDPAAVVTEPENPAQPQPVMLNGEQIKED